MTPEEEVNWTCPEGCGEQYWAHQLWGSIECDDGLACPPPPEPKDCCGRLPGRETEELRTCSNGTCQTWWCVCGVFTGMSAGPVHCGCEYDRGEVPTTRDDAAASADDDLT